MMVFRILLDSIGLYKYLSGFFCWFGLPLKEMESCDIKNSQKSVSILLGFKLELQSYEKPEKKKFFDRKRFLFSPRSLLIEHMLPVCNFRR